MASFAVDGGEGRRPRTGGGHSHVQCAIEPAWPVSDPEDGDGAPAAAPVTERYGVGVWDAPGDLSALVNRPGFSPMSGLGHARSRGRL